MIARLSGTIVERGPGTLVVDCGGVGYEVHCSAYTFGAVGPVGSEVTLRVYTQFQEGHLALYGFASAEERQLFDLLITVKNVGPASAIKILGAGAGPQDLARMITAEQASALKGIKGIGKKTAELLVVELRDRCQDLLASWGAGSAGTELGRPAAPPIGVPGPRPPVLDEVTHALVQLGWKQAEADKAVAQLVVEKEANLESLLRQALRSMPR